MKREVHCKFDIEIELDIVKAYKEGKSSIELAKEFNVSDTTIRNILEAHNVKRRTLSEAFYNYYSKQRRFKFPMSKFVPELMKSNFQSYFQLLVAVHLLLDGCLTWRSDREEWKISFFNKHREPVNIFADLMYFAYEHPPSSISLINRKNRTSYWEICYVGRRTQPIAKRLLKLTPSYKTGPANNQSVEEYLSEPQPNLTFLMKANERVKKLCARFAFSQEGSITPNFSGETNFRATPNLKFTCAHPKLIKSWGKIFKELGLRLQIKNGRTWSGIKGLNSSSLTTFSRLIAIGNFIPNYFVTGDSPYSGLPKRVLAKAVLEYNELPLRIRKRYKKLPGKERHEIIRKIVARVNEV